MKYKPLSLQSPSWYAWCGRIVIAIFAAAYVVLVRQTDPFRFFAKPQFWIMLLASTILALVSMVIIEITSVYLNEVLPWKGKKWYLTCLRLLLQLILAFEIPRLLILFSVKALLGTRFSDSGYMQSEYYMMVWMLIVYNFIVAGILIVLEDDRVYRKYGRWSMWKKSRNDWLEELELADGFTRRIMPLEEIVVLHKRKGLSMACTADGNQYTFFETLDRLAECLNPENFIRINRWTIVHMKWVDGLELKAAPTVLFTQEIADHFPESVTTSLEISDTYRKRFMETYRKRVGKA
ncbi:hypothetical protein GCM10023231_01220 [Olivibacter ginsenosidimutans]|uniref:HTH LytTR-type domain-containing protein n=1 Tax=Olivibacter ginsenosidimutans TaxID=1176537 RepID=A0ABP9AEC6_9SPHI